MMYHLTKSSSKLDWESSFLQKYAGKDALLIYHNAAFPKLRNLYEAGTWHEQTGTGRRTHIIQLNAMARQVSSVTGASWIPEVSNVLHTFPNKKVTVTVSVQKGVIAVLKTCRQLHVTMQMQKITSSLFQFSEEQIWNLSSFGRQTRSPFLILKFALWWAAWILFCVSRDRSRQHQELCLLNLAKNFVCILMRMLWKLQCNFSGE